MLRRQGGGQGWNGSSLQIQIFALASGPEYCIGFLRGPAKFGEPKSGLMRDCNLSTSPDHNRIGGDHG